MTPELFGSGLSGPGFVPDSLSGARPVVGAPPPWLFPPARRTTLDNGLRVVVYFLPGQHVASANLVVDLPLTVEDRQREGVATVTARCLDEGSLRHPGEQFSELLEAEGAGFGVEVSLSGTQVTLDVPMTRLEPALRLFAEAVTEPALADVDVERHVRLRLAEIEQQRANSASVASVAFRAAVFDPASRAARMSGGEPETVSAVDPGSARAFYASRYAPQAATLILAGDFATDPVPLVNAILGGWKAPDVAPVEHVPAEPGPRVHRLVDRPGSVQADLRYGGFTVDRGHPDWPDLQVAGHAMGGAFLSRLNARLREELGYTYGVRMVFGPLRRGGSFAVQGSFRTEVLAAAVTEARTLLDVRSRPFTAAEVRTAVDFFSGVSPLRYATADGVADQAGTQVLADLDDGYVDANLAALRAVTPESVTVAYRAHVRPDDLTLVVVGEAATVAPRLREEGFDSLEVVQP